MTDGELLAAYGRTGDGAAFAAVVARHRPWVVAAARRMVGGDPHAADDVAQAVFVLLARRATAVAGHHHLGGWLLRATGHESAHVRRAAARRTRREQWAAALRWQWAAAASPAGGWGRLSAVLDEQVAALRPGDREAILLRFYQGHEMADVAAALGVSEAAARKRVTRAVGKLRERLRDRTGLDAAAGPLAAWLADVARPAAEAPPAPGRTPLRLRTDRPNWLARVVGGVAAVAVVAVVVMARPPASRPSPAPPVPVAAVGAEPPATDLTGRVLAADDTPVAGATVTLADWEPDAGAPPVARSDVAGTYHLPAVTRAPDGRPAVGCVVAWADGHGPGATDAIAFVPGRRDVRLPPPADLTLTFRRPDGRPAAGLPVHVVVVHWRSRPQQPFKDVPTNGLEDRPPFRRATDAAGACTFADLPRGADVRLSVDDPRYAQLDRGQTFPLPAEGAASAAAVDLTPAASIAGRVTFGPTGRPVAGVGVMAWTPGGHQPVDAVRTAADGTYTLGQLVGGHYSVEVATNTGRWMVDQMSNQWTSYQIPDVLAEPGRPATGCDLTLIHGVVLRGRVVDDDGRPVAGVGVGTLADPSHGDNFGRGVRTDAAGAFSFRLPPGPATVGVFNDLPAGFARTDASVRTVTVGDGDDPPVELRVDRRG